MVLVTVPVSPTPRGRAYKDNCLPKIRALRIRTNFLYISPESRSMRNLGSEWRKTSNLLWETRAQIDLHGLCSLFTVLGKNTKWAAGHLVKVAQDLSEPRHLALNPSLKECIQIKLQRSLITQAKSSKKYK